MYVSEGPQPLSEPCCEEDDELFQACYQAHVSGVVEAADVERAEAALLGNPSGVSDVNSISFGYLMDGFGSSWGSARMAAQRGPSQALTRPSSMLDVNALLPQTFAMSQTSTGSGGGLATTTSASPGTFFHYTSGYGFYGSGNSGMMGMAKRQPSTKRNSTVASMKAAGKSGTAKEEPGRLQTKTSLPTIQSTIAPGDYDLGYFTSDISTHAYGVKSPAHPAKEPPPKRIVPNPPASPKQETKVAPRVSSSSANDSVSKGEESVAAFMMGSDVGGGVSGLYGSLFKNLPSPEPPRARQVREATVLPAITSAAPRAPSRPPSVMSSFSFSASESTGSLSAYGSISDPQDFAVPLFSPVGSLAHASLFSLRPAQPPPLSAPPSPARVASPPTAVKASPRSPAAVATPVEKKPSPPPPAKKETPPMEVRVVGTAPAAPAAVAKATPSTPRAPANKSASPPPHGTKAPTPLPVPKNNGAEPPEEPVSFPNHVQSLAVVGTPCSRCTVLDDRSTVRVITNAIDGKTTTLEVTEAVTCDTLNHDAPINSLLLTDIQRHLIAGHRASLLVSFGEGGGAVATTTIRTTVKGILAQLKKKQRYMDLSKSPSPGDYGWRVEVSAGRIRDRGNTVRDLLPPPEGTGGDENDGNGEAELPIHAVANPTVGHWLDHLGHRSVTTPGEVDVALETAYRWVLLTDDNIAKEMHRAKDVLVIFVTVRQAAGLKGSKENYDVRICSLTIFVTRGASTGAKLFMAPEKLRPSMRSLVRNLGVECFTVAVTCVTEQTRSAELCIRECRSLSALRTTEVRACDVRRFREAAEEQLMAARERVNGAGLSEVMREHLEKTFAAQEEVLESIQAVLNDPLQEPIDYFPDRVAEREEAEDDAAAVAAESFSTGAAPPPPPWAKSEDAAGGPARGATPLMRAPSRDSPSAPLFDVTISNTVFKDRHMHFIAVVDESTSGYRCAGSTKVTRVEGITIVAGKKAGDSQDMTARSEYVLDEVIPKDGSHTRNREFGVAEASSQLSELCALFASGTNCMVFSLDGHTENLLSSPAWSVLRYAVQMALCIESPSWELRISMSMVREDGMVMELLKENEEWRPLQVASSPLFGPVVHMAEKYTLQSEDDFEAVMQAFPITLASQWSTTPNCVIFTSLLLCYSSGHDKLVSSLTCCVAGSHRTVLKKILMRAPSVSESVDALHRSGIKAHPAAVLLVSLNAPSDSVHALSLVSRVQGLSSVRQKEALQVGSVRHFVKRTRAKLQKRQAKASSEHRPAERAHQDRVNERIARMIDDYEHLLADTEQHFPKSYVLESVATEGDSQTQTPSAVQDSSVRYRNSPRFQQESSSRRGGSGGGSKSGSGVSPPPPPLPNEMGSPLNLSVTQPRGAVAPPRDPDRHPCWLLGVERAGTVAGMLDVHGNSVTWKPTQETFETDHVLMYDPIREDVQEIVTAAPPLSSLVEHVRAGKSCALLGVASDTVSSNAALDIPLWVAFRHLLSTACFTSQWEEGSEVQLRIVAVCDRKVTTDYLAEVADMVSETVEKKATVSASPLFGPVVATATALRVRSAKSCLQIVRRALELMNRVELPSNTVVVASAVLKQVVWDTREDRADVILSSISAFRARVVRDLPVLRNMLDLDPKGSVPPGLFRYAFAGNCRLLCFTTLGLCPDGRATEALRLSQGVARASSLPSAVGSVRTYIEQNKAELQRQVGHDSAAATTHQKRVQVIQDMEDMLLNPKDALAIAYPVDDGTVPRDGGYSSAAPLPRQKDVVTPSPYTSSAGIMPVMQLIKCVAVVTMSSKDCVTDMIRVRPESRSVMTGGHTFHFDEVLVRADRNALVRPGMLDDVTHRLLDGYNVGLLLADGRGSTTGAAVLTRVMSSITTKAPTGGSSFYISAVALQHGMQEGSASTIRQDMVRDLLKDCNYEPLVVATSPLFGPCVNGAKFSLFARLNDIHVLIRDALKVCEGEKAALVLVLVVKQELPEEEDVLMSSLFTVVTTSESTPKGVFPSTLFQDALSEQETYNRGLFRACLGGACSTYAVVGLSTSTPPDEREALLNTWHELSQVRCYSALRGSAKELRRMTTDPMMHSNTHGPSIASNPKPQDVELELDRIKIDTDQLLENPSASVVRTYIEV